MQLLKVLLVIFHGLLCSRLFLVVSRTFLTKVIRNHPKSWGMLLPVAKKILFMLLLLRL